MSSDLFRKYIDILKEAEGGAVSQNELAEIYPKAKTLKFVKNTPVALVPFAQLAELFGVEKAKDIADLAGMVDKTSYEEAWKSRGYVVFQWDGKRSQPDIYIAEPDAVKNRYVKFTGSLPTDAKARGKIPSLVVLDFLKLDASKVPFYVKTVPTEMISADEVGLAGKTIQTSWGEQTVQQGGFLVREPNGHIYTVASDEKGLPIGYIPAQ